LINFVYTAAAATNVGNVRKNNEDNLFFDGVCFNAEENIISTELVVEEIIGNSAFAVFDGMGGESNGEKASELAANAFRAQFGDSTKYGSSNSIYKKLKKFYSSANKAIRRLSKKIRSTSGTTAATIVIAENIAYVSNIGDSKVIRLNSGELEQLSEDHTMAELMIRSGAMSREEAKKTKGKNALTRFIGASKEDYDCSPYYSEPIEIREEDCFLLCSDGLTDMVSVEEIKKIIGNQNLCCTEKVHLLIDTALNFGGKDNCTVILISAN